MTLEPSLDFLEKYARKPAVFALVCALVLLWLFKQGWAPVSNPRNVFDSYSYYYAAKALSQGQNPYDNESLKSLGKAEAGLKDIYPYLYPPLLAGLWRPMTYLSPLQAHKALIIANVLLIGLNFFLLYKIVRPKRHPHALFLGFVLFQPLNFTLVMTIKLGQINPLVMLLVLLCLYFHLRERETLSAAVLALAILLKLTPGILLIYFLFLNKRRWAFLIKLAGALAGFVILSFFVAAPENWAYFIENTLSGPPYKTIGSFWGQLAIFAQFSPFLDSAKLWLYSCFSLILLFISIQSLRRCEISQRPYYAFALLILLTIFLSPLTWYHHYYFCLLTFFYLPVYLWDQGKSSAFLGYVAMVFIMLANIPKPLAQFTGESFVLALSLLKTALTFGVLVMTIACRPKPALDPPSPA